MHPSPHRNCNVCDTGGLPTFLADGKGVHHIIIQRPALWPLYRGLFLSRLVPAPRGKAVHECKEWRSPGAMGQGPHRPVGEDTREHICTQAPCYMPPGGGLQLVEQADFLQKG
jgi:hypothetical protein